MAKTRLDQWLVDNGHYPTRARARDAILRGCVSIEGDVSAKPSRTVAEYSKISICDPAISLVSRAGLKLAAALEKADFDPSDRISLDLGASTGGFCQVLLNAGAKHVYAVDVGHGQMDARLIENPRLTNIEGLNARDLSLKHTNGERPEFITCDVSFISLKLALPSALRIAARGAQGIFLIKPQFEVGKEGLGKGGVVRNEALAESTAQEIAQWLNSNPGWRCTDLLPSPIAGGDGNTEFLMAGIKS